MSTYVDRLKIRQKIVKMKFLLLNPFFTSQTITKIISRGYIWARGEKIPGYLIFVDLPSLRPKWSGSKRILITFAPNTKSPHHILRANFVFSKKIIRKTYKTASPYMLKRPIKCLKFVFDVQNIIFCNQKCF